MIPGAHVFTPFILLQKPLWGSVRGKAGTGARRQLRQKLGVNTEIGRRLLQVQADLVATFESLLFSAGNHANCAGKLLNSSASKKTGTLKSQNARLSHPKQDKLLIIWESSCAYRAREEPRIQNSFSYILFLPHSGGFKMKMRETAVFKANRLFNIWICCVGCKRAFKYV